MSSIKTWLEQISLERYASVFEENEIEIQDLPELSESDLNELGIPMGPKKRILKSLANIRGSNTEYSVDIRTGVESISRDSSDLFEQEAERRQLTVMFCDLVGSTSIAQALDPEDLRTVNRNYQDFCAQTIERYGGYIAKYMGDGVIAYFGYPQAHEDDAERAIRSGLELVQAVPELRFPDIEKSVRLTIRVGIATGPVVVGDLIGEGSSQEKAVVGETPNLAARLEAWAPENAVVVAPEEHESVKLSEHSRRSRVSAPQQEAVPSQVDR